MLVIVGLVLAAVAALLHVYIFALESVLWTKPAALKTFGTSPEEAEATKELAFNQGFYNLFLAIVTAIGIILVGPAAGAGHALVFAGTGSMLAAALVLFVSSPGKRAAAIKQGTIPLLAVAVLAIGLLAG